MQGAAQMPRPRLAPALFCNASRQRLQERDITVDSRFGRLGERKRKLYELHGGDAAVSNEPTEGARRQRGILFRPQLRE
jgi:hypothetical protein